MGFNNPALADRVTQRHTAEQRDAREHALHYHRAFPNMR